MSRYLVIGSRMMDEVVMKKARLPLGFTNDRQGQIQNALLPLVVLAAGILAYAGKSLIAPRLYTVRPNDENSFNTSKFPKCL